MGLMDINTYPNTIKSGEEFLTTDRWQVVIIKPPETYFPGEEIFQLRTNKVSGFELPSVSTLESKIRGHTHIQTGNSDALEPRKVTLTVNDLSDQTMFAFLKSYVDSAQNPLTGSRVPIGMLQMHWRFYILDSTDRIVRYWDMPNSVISSISYSQDMTMISDVAKVGEEVTFELTGMAFSYLATVPPK